MRKTGNGAATVCAQNLLQMVRGEVPYDRIKGLNPRIIDRPAGEAEAELRQDAAWLVETYEPRAELGGVTVVPVGSAGNFSVEAQITEKEE